jgi:HMG (high mobility group) box
MCEISKELGKMWADLPDDEKKVFQVGNTFI